MFQIRAYYCGLYGVDMDLWPDDTDPHIRELATSAFLDAVFGRGFLLRRARMNDCEEWLDARLRELSVDAWAGSEEPRAPAGGAD